MAGSDGQRRDIDMKELKDMTEEEMLKEIDLLIESAPEEYRLKELQNKCDMIRQKYKDNPVGSMLAIHKLMLEHSNKLTVAMRKLTHAK